MPNVEWLLHEAAQPRPLQVGERMTVDNDYWLATIERLELGPGLRIFLTTATVHQDLTVEPRDAETAPWMASNIAVDGQVDIDMPDGQRAHVGPERAILFRPSDRNPRYVVGGRQKLKLAGYSLRRDRIERLFDDRVPDILRPLLEQEVTASQIVAMQADRRLRRLGNALFAPNLNGPLRTLYMEGAVLQLLALQSATTARARAGMNAAKDKQLIHDARDRLLADMRQPPSLGELAAAVGLTERQMNAGFRAAFGATVFEVLRNERLEHARVALETGAVPLKEIAFRVGYNHSTNFIRAFTMRYGVPPGRYAERAKGK